MPRHYQHQTFEQLRHTIEQLSGRIEAAERHKDFRSANRLIANRSRARRLLSAMQRMRRQVQAVTRSNLCPPSPRSTRQSPRPLRARLPNTATILSYGMGVESSAILLRWILEPQTRPCDLRDLIVITAQTGNEYSDTGRDVERHILPLLRQYGIRFVQLARHGHLEADGITVLSDTRQPTTVYLDGDYRLSDELRKNGTVPMCSGVHKCALKFKAFVIESWLAQTPHWPRPPRHRLQRGRDLAGGTQ